MSRSLSSPGNFLEIGILFLSLHFFSVSRLWAQPAVVTDKTDYHPGETLVITGSGWLPGEAVLLRLEEISTAISTEHIIQVDADASGKISNQEFVFNKSHKGTYFILKAAGRSSGLSAETSFTDGSITITSNTDWSALDDPDLPGIQPPGANDVIYIRNGATLRVNVSDAVCAGIQLGLSGGAKPGDGSLILAENSKITVAGDVMVGFSSRKSNGFVQFSNGSSMTVAGNLTLGYAGGGAGSLDMSQGGLLQIGASFSSPNTGNFVPGTGTVEYNGSGSQKILQNAALGDKPYYQLKISGTDIKTAAGDLLVGQAMTVNGNFQSGGFDVKGTGDLIVNAGARFGWSSLNPPTLSGTKSLNINSVFEYNRNDVQNVAPYSYGDLVFTSTTPVIKALLGNISVAGELKILSNNICATTENYILTILSTGSINVAGSGTAYIDGNLSQVYTGPGSKNFPVGKNGNYRPITLTYTSLTGPSTVQVKQVETSIPGNNPSGYTIQTDRFWVVTQTGGSNFQYDIKLDGDPFSPGSNEPYIIKGDGINNIPYSATYSNPFFSGTGLNSFGNFALAYATPYCPDPIINSQPASVTACTGGSAVFHVMADYAGTLTYKWYKAGSPSIQLNDADDGGDIQISDNGATLTIINIIDTDAGEYFAVITNDCGSNVNTSQATLSVTLPPTISNAGEPQTICPGNSTSLDANSPSVGTGAWSVVSGPSTDNAQFSDPENPASTFTPNGGNGIYILRWTISNQPCSPSYSDVTITVDVVSLPVIICPPNIVAETDDDGTGNCTTTVNLGTPNVSGSCNVSSLVATVDEVPIDPATYAFGTGVTDVIWVVTDGSGNTASCLQTVTVTDNESPTISCPPDVIAGTSNDGEGDCSTIYNLGTPSVSDNCQVSTLVAKVNGVIIDPATYSFGLGVTTITWIVTDIAGNAASCSQTITVTDNEAPTIVCPADVTVECEADIPAVNISSVTASDNCSPVTVTHLGDVKTGSCATGIIITRTYTASDVAGNTAMCSQVITVNHVTQPHMVTESSGGDNVIGLTRYTHELVVVDAATVSVQSAAELTLAGHSVHAGQTIARNPVSGKYYSILRLNDLPDSRPFVAVDLSTGVCTLIGELGDKFNSMTFTPGGKLYAMTDDEAVVPESLYEINITNAAKTFLKSLGNGDDGDIIAFNKDDGYIYHWSGSINRVFEKIDTTNFTVTNIPYSGFKFNEVIGAIYRGNGIFLVSDLTNINSIVGSNYVSLSVTGFANSINYQEYNVLRGFASTGSVIPESSVVQCESDAPAPTILPVVLDVCGNIITPPSPLIGGSFNSCSGTKTYTYNYADCAGLTFIWTYTYTIIDKINPVITCPSGNPFSRNTATSFYTITGAEFDASAGDNCVNPSLSWSVSGATTINGITTLAGVTLNPGSNTIQWTATNACGNASTCSITVNVNQISTGTRPGETILLEERKPFSLNAFPNPSGDQFTLILEGAGNEKVTVTAHDVLGRLVYKSETKDAKSPIRFGENLQKGVYFVQVIQGENRRIIKVVKL